jgi:hypothetical protein
MNQLQRKNGISRCSVMKAITKSENKKRLTKNPINSQALQPKP